MSFFSRMRSEGFSFYILGVLGWRRVCLTLLLVPATVRNRLRTAIVAEKLSCPWGKRPKRALSHHGQRSCHVVLRGRGGTLNTLHSTLCTLITLHTLHSTLSTTLYTPHFTLYTGHSTLHISHFTLYTPHSTLYTPHSTLYAPHSTLHTLHSHSLYAPHFTLHTLHSTLYIHTFHFALHVFHFTLHTHHSTLYTPHSTSTFDFGSPYLRFLHVICIRVRWFLPFLKHATRMSDSTVKDSRAVTPWPVQQPMPSTAGAICQVFWKRKASGCAAGTSAGWGSTSTTQIIPKWPICGWGVVNVWLRASCSSTPRWRWYYMILHMCSEFLDGWGAQPPIHVSDEMDSIGCGSGFVRNKNYEN